LKKELNQKNEELGQMQQIFEEYQNWRSKIETIEKRMQEENQGWKVQTERLQKENESLQRESLKLVSKCSDLQGKLEKAEKKASTLGTVEEVVCQNCNGSLEESQYLGSSRRGSPEQKEQTPSA
jgi:chromosome segregation ATPase